MKQKEYKKYDYAITACVMDLFHTGHKELLDIMRENAYYVITFLHDDFSTFQNKNKFPVQEYNHRERNLLNFVDEVVKVKDKNPQLYFDSFIKKNLDKKIVYIRGDDWVEFPGKSTLDYYGIHIIYKKYTEDISSTLLRKELEILRNNIYRKNFN